MATTFRSCAVRMFEALSVRKPVWLVRPRWRPGDCPEPGERDGLIETRNFYERAATRAQDVHIRQLLDDLAQEERSHEDRAEALFEKDKLAPGY